MFFACGIWCLADISSAGPSPEQKGSDEGLTLETPAEHHIPQAKRKQISRYFRCQKFNEINKTIIPFALVLI